jgi:RNA polymerase sigma factor (sigma-70 family)
MSDDTSFRDLIGRVRAGDAQAATDLVRQYEPTIRVIVRRRLTDPAMRRLLDSTDICQSVLGNFLVRAAAGQFDLETPDQLLRLLATMARNKLASHARKQRAQRRDPAHTGLPGESVSQYADPQPSPSEVVATTELLHEVRRRLSPDERRLVELRAQNYSWAEIAEQVDGRPDALRMQLTRAVTRVVQELGLEE